MRIGTCLALLAAAMVMAAAPGEALARDHHGAGVHRGGVVVGHGLPHQGFKGRGLHHKRFERHGFSRPFVRRGVRKFHGPLVHRFTRRHNHGVFGLHPHRTIVIGPSHGVRRHNHGVFGLHLHGPAVIHRR